MYKIHDFILIAIKILLLELFVSVVSLCRASMVCQLWEHYANDASLWRQYCFQLPWRLSLAAEQKQLKNNRLTPNDNIAVINTCRIWFLI